MLPKGLLKEHWRVVDILIRIMDMLMIFFAGWLAYAIKFQEYRLVRNYLIALIIAVLLSQIVFAFLGIYRSMRGKGFLTHSIHMLQAISILGLILAGLAFLTKSGTLYSRYWFLLWMLLTLLWGVSRFCLHSASISLKQELKAFEKFNVT